MTGCTCSNCGNICSPSAAATVAGPTLGPDEVIVKKAALLTMQEQMAALVRGEDLPASQPGVREVQDVPYVVPGGGKRGH